MLDSQICVMFDLNIFPHQKSICSQNWQKLRYLIQCLILGDDEQNQIILIHILKSTIHSKTIDKYSPKTQSANLDNSK